MGGSGSRREAGFWSHLPQEAGGRGSVSWPCQPHVLPFWGKRPGPGGSGPPVSTSTRRCTDSARPLRNTQDLHTPGASRQGLSKAAQIVSQLTDGVLTLKANPRRGAIVPITGASSGCWCQIEKGGGRTGAGCHRACTQKHTCTGKHGEGYTCTHGHTRAHMLGSPSVFSGH